ncbi:hypothetical protein JX265_009103 [Neoarthrinium moseri]|uniref:F-box domain-containing protein n=1 Tax=Neoarthrinium moseri TaxID=1658444 RepID=A0A9P9WHD5_9PEZI|nr:hypothetical protein JX265_009103 [Neoarthrinium moseri]
MESQVLRLPWELILAIMMSYLPSNAATLIPASDKATQLLLSFSLASRLTHEFAVGCLQRHCIFLDSDDRLRRFLLSLEAWRGSDLDLPSIFENISAMYLAPFGSVMDNLPTAAWVRDVFGYTSRTLRRLVVDMPFDSLPPWNDHLNVGPVLREGFERLVNLEEFVCTRDAVRLGISDETRENEHSSVLYRWPKLRRLGLNRPMCNNMFWECLANLPNLEYAVFASALALMPRSLDVGASYLGRMASPITIVLADIRVYRPAPPPFLPRENTAEEGGGGREKDGEGLQLMAYRIPIPERRNFLDSCSEWLIGMALAGELWHTKGERIATVPELAVPVQSLLDVA